MGDLKDAVQGDLRGSLEALRDALAGEIETPQRCVKCGGSISSSTAPLAKQLRDVLNQLASLQRPEGSRNDELKKRRAARQAGVAKRAGRSVDKRQGGGRTRGERGA